MTTLQLHILIEQILQQMGNFAYDDLEREEVDVIINHSIDRLLSKVFAPKDKRVIASTSKSGFEDVQVKVDDFKVLKVEEVSLAGLANVGKRYTANLPNDYYHLANDRSVVSKPNCDDLESVNRLTDSEIVHTIIRNGLSKPVPESPVSSLSPSTIVVYTDGVFTIKEVIIDYYRKPAVVDYTTPAGGTGILEFPDTTCRKIAEEASKVASVILEQMQNKTALLKALQEEVA